MAELTQQERLQPSLLDRLADDKRHRVVESREERVIATLKLRNCVIRDLESLLNATRKWSDQELEGYPYVAGTTLNYGIPDLSGMHVVSMDVVELQASIRAAIIAYEPRIDAQSLRVTGAADPGAMNRRSLTLFIEAQMWAHPMPLALYLRTDVDLESGRFSVGGQS
jgi:type VI secretion system protein ImpF